MKSNDSTINKVAMEASRQGVARTSAFTASERMQLTRLTRAGRLERLTRGVYALSNAKGSKSSLVIASLKAPRSVVCLISALSYHGMTTQIPWEASLAISANAKTPSVGSLPVRFVWYSSTMLSTGVETVTIDGVPVKIFNPGKTVVDCFKYRNKIGLDVFLEALREGWRRRMFTIEDLWKYAKACRVTTVIRPYIESLV